MEGRTTLKNDTTKSHKRRIRELAALAYERELARELGAIERGFARWRSGEINARELTDLIHGFHDGPARELYSIYNSNVDDFVVGSAIARGILSEDEAAPEIMELLATHIQFARDDLD
jgi:hypothetical protein